MKKVARMRLSPNNLSEEMSNQNLHSHSSNSEPIVRTTGRIKKPKAVFDPSDNYLPRAQRSLHTGTTTSNLHHTTSSTLERRTSYTKGSTTVSPSVQTEPNKDACVVCKKKESKRPVFASKNPLITCQECQRKIHKICLKVDFEEFESVQRNYTCDQCTTCRICNETFNNPDEEMITCSKCTKSFHYTCFPSKIIKSENQRNWKCNKCQVYNNITNGTTLPVKKIREIIGGAEPLSNTTPIKAAAINSAIEKSSPEENFNKVAPTTTAPPLAKRLATKTEETGKNGSSPPPPEKRSKSSTQSPDTISVETASLNAPYKAASTVLCFTPNENFDDIPDVKEWSVDQVYEYFCKHFPKEAHVFKDEEIDGRSLLLLKRSDVVKKLPIKLGPSLRIYSLILKIQAQLNDPTLGWNCGL
ncbi:L(3)mbt interactor in ovarian somatic cells [Cochliomyia hominivorax]